MMINKQLKTKNELLSKIQKINWIFFMQIKVKFLTMGRGEVSWKMKKSAAVNAARRTTE
jgi:hypothetical protein